MCPHHTPSILLDRTPELFLSQSVAVQMPLATAASAGMTHFDHGNLTRAPTPFIALDDDSIIIPGELDRADHLGGVSWR